MKGRKPSELINDIRYDICNEWFGRLEKTVWPLWLDDILYGVARLDWYGDREQQIPLSTASILQCFLNLDVISTKSVMELLQLKQRMARKYAAACRIAYPFLKRSLEDDIIKNRVYPHRTLVSYEHGMRLGYNR